MVKAKLINLELEIFILHNPFLSMNGNTMYGN
jgi:hypothetical protein